MSKNANLSTARVSQISAQPLDNHTAQSHSGEIHYNTAEFNMRHLLGKVLTIVDASLADKEQKKAAKDLIKDAFKASLGTFQINCFGSGMQTINIEPFSNGPLA